MSCEHPSCHCQSEVGIERQGKDYCSEYCAGAAPDSEEACRCGHAGCAGEELLSPREDADPRGPTAHGV